MIKEIDIDSFPALKKELHWRMLFPKELLDKAQQIIIRNLKINDSYFFSINKIPPRSITAHVIKTGGRSSNNYHICGVYGTPDTFENESEDFKGCRFECSICKTKKPCEHTAALFLNYEKHYGKWIVEESEYDRRTRVRELIHNQFIEDIKKEREQFKRDPVPALNFFPKIVQHRGLVHFDFTGILEKCVTCEAAIQRARDILEARDKHKIIQDVNLTTQIYNREQVIKLVVDTDFYSYPDRVNLSCHIYLNNIMWMSEQSKMLRLPYDYTPEELNGKQFLNEYQLIAIQETIKEVDKKNLQCQDVTDQSALSFFSEMEKSWDREADDFQKKHNTSRQQTTEEQLELSLRINHDNSAADLSFKLGKAGSSKSFVIKNIKAFLNAFYNSEKFELTKTNTIDFKHSSFTEKSIPILRFIQTIDATIKQVHSANLTDIFFSREPKIIYQQPLHGYLLDSFYTMAEGLTAEYVNKNENIKNPEMYIGSSDIRFKLTIDPTYDAKNQVSGIEVSGIIPSLHSGVADSYVISSNALTKISEQDAEFLKPFASLIKKRGSFYFYVGLPNLNEFYYRILPTLMENPHVEIEDNTEGKIGKLLAPEPVFDFYLDLLDDSIVNLKANVSYDDKTFDLDAKSDKKAYRDERQEKRVINELNRTFTKSTSEDATWFRDMDDDSLFNFLNFNIDRLSKLGTVHGSDAFNRIKIKKNPSIKIGVSVESNLLDISITSPDIDKKELVALLKSYTLKKRWHKLSSGEFIDLSDNESLQEMMDLLDKIDLVPADVIHKKAKIPLFRALYLDKLMQEHEELSLNRDNTYRKIIRSFNQIKDSDYEPPKNLQNIMREYQTYGYKWLETIKNAGFGGILADDMGLGKTLQTISVLLDSVENPTSENHQANIVVCPASLVYNWIEEMNRFAPKIRAVPLTGNLSSRKKALEQIDKTDVFVISYDLLSKDITLYQDIEFATVIIDEAQYIKNPKAGQSKAVKALKAKTHLALTGTPIENRLSELWSIFDFIMPGFLYSYNEFSKKFENAITKNQDEAAIQKLKNMTAPFILRRKKVDVLKNLPSKIDEVRYIRISGEQQKLYDAQVLKMKQLIQLSGNSGEDKIKILAELTKIRQICCDPSLLFSNYSKESAKKEACMQLVESAIDGGHRMLIFSQFTSMLEILEKELSDRKISYYKITGATTKERRMTMVHDFNEGDVPVFLISLKAGGTGLNLVGADTVIHYDPWWNQAAQNQATDRAHRIGQTKNVTVYRMILKDTIEEKILKLQETKKDLADSILEGNNQSLMSLSSEELLQLFS